MQKAYFWLSTGKVSSSTEFWIIELVQVQNFSLNCQFYLLGPNLPGKRYFWSKTEKAITTIEFLIFELVWISNFTPNKQFWILDPSLLKKVISGLKYKKWVPPLNLHIRVRLGAKFQLKLTISIFLTKFV